jgi:hypothetical protein
MFESLIHPMLAVLNDASGLRGAYSDYIRSIQDSPLWSSPSCTSGLRIPWRQAKSAANHPELQNAFRSPGLYLFGDVSRIPMYVGMTKGSLWSRLRGRYVCGRRYQCQIAVDYGRELITRGMDGFPDDVREWYRKGFGTSTVRLRGSLAFARSGIEGIWFTLLPVADPDSVRNLERALIPVALEWNVSHGYPPLLNVQDV